MDIPPASPTPATPEIQQAMLMKRQLERQQVQNQQLIESARSDPQGQASSPGSSIGRNLDSKA